MSDQEQGAPEATPDVVQSEAEQVEAPEAAESTEGQPTQDVPAEDKPEGEAEDKPDKLTRNQRRRAHMDALEKQAREAEAENKRLADELAEFKKFAEAPPPKAEDFDDHDDYIAASAAHRSLQAMDQRAASKLERQAQTAQENFERVRAEAEKEAHESWAAQVAEAKQKYADFDSVVFTEELKISPEMGRVLASSEVGADVAYHLGMNRDLAARIAAMPVQQQAGAIAMLELTVPHSTPKPKTQSSAPEPVSPVKATGTGTADPLKKTPDEYRAWREAGGTF